MIRKLIRFSATHRLIVLTCTVVALVFSAWAMRRVPWTRCRIFRTPRSSSIPNGTAAPTSSRTSSPTPS